MLCFRKKSRFITNTTCTVKKKMSALAPERFRGCLAGGLVGDCYGWPFENEHDPRLRPQVMVSDFLNKNVKDSDSKEKPVQWPYSDDTEMAKSVALSLIECKGFDAVDMARKFTTEYYTKSRDRGYGNHVVDVFRKLKDTDFQDVFKPSREQFNGKGSYGNGGPMRTAPVALFCYNSDVDRLIHIAKQTCLLTHAHRDAYNGSILQCLAVYYALRASPLEPIDPESFLDSLKTEMKKLEMADQKCDEKNHKPYCEQLKNIKKALQLKNITDEVVTLLGNDITALRSVPIAIYAFLRGLQPVPEFESNNPFFRTLYLALRLGGDTDTIGCMACSIAGAYHGIEFVPKELREKCEGSEMIIEISDKMAEIVGIKIRSES